MVRSNIAPLIAEQYKPTRLYVRTFKNTNERVIVDPSQTLTRIFVSISLISLPG